MHVDLAAFLPLSILLILIPGPDTAVVTKNALVGGRRAGIGAAVGVATGLTIWTLAAAFGIAALLRASAVAFDALKIAGAAYLVWMGVGMLRRPGAAAALAATGGAARAQPRRRALRQGILSDLGNPKIAVFFTSFLPQFVHGHGSAFASLALLGGTFAVLTLLWLGAYSVVIGHGGRLLRPKVQRALDRFTGLVLVGFGIELALEHR